MIKDFETWEKYTGFAEGSGRSEKEWIVNSNGEIALLNLGRTIGLMSIVLKK